MIDEKVVCVDFDGVLAFHSKPHMYDVIGRPLRPGFELVRDLHNKGYDVVVLTARDPSEHDAIWRWLNANNVGGVPLAKYISKVTNIKVPALKYYDDRAVLWPSNKEF